jgi:hypothetical protein
MVRVGTFPAVKHTWAIHSGFKRHCATGMIQLRAFKRAHCVTHCVTDLRPQHTAAGVWGRKQGIMMTLMRRPIGVKCCIVLCMDVLCPTSTLHFFRPRPAPLW